MNKNFSELSSVELIVLEESLCSLGDSRTNLQVFVLVLGPQVLVLALGPQSP